MRIVFLGSGAIGVPALRRLASLHEVAAVVTQPDKPAGRSLRLTACPIKQAAESLGLRIFQPAKIRAPEAVAMLAELHAEAFVVAAYGQILPRAVLDLPKLATLNIHASLLPRHRGAAPIHAALLSGDDQTGITIMWVNEELDAGDLLLQMPCAIEPKDTAGSLHDRLAELAPAAIEKALELLASGRAPRIPQDHARATYAPKLDRAAGRLDFRQEAAQVERHVRAMHPWPGAWMDLGGSAFLKVHRAAVAEFMPGTTPGEVLPQDNGRVVIACGRGSLELLEVQAPGGRRMSTSEFLRGHPLPAKLPLPEDSPSHRTPSRL